MFTCFKVYLGILNDLKKNFLFSQVLVVLFLFTCSFKHAQNLDFIYFMSVLLMHYFQIRKKIPNNGWEIQRAVNVFQVVCSVVTVHRECLNTWLCGLINFIIIVNNWYCKHSTASERTPVDIVEKCCPFYFKSVKNKSLIYFKSIFLLSCWFGVFLGWVFMVFT